MDPVDWAPGVRDRVVGHLHADAKVASFVHRPLRERAVTEVIPDQYRLRNQLRQTRDRASVTLPGVARSPSEHLFYVLGLVREIPLDRELLGRNRFEQATEFACHQILERLIDDRVVVREMRPERVQRAHRKWQPDLVPQTL